MSVLIITQQHMAQLREMRRQYGVSFVLVTEDMLNNPNFNRARVVDVHLGRENGDPNSPLLQMTLTQHYGALCGVHTGDHDRQFVCDLAPGHAGDHHPYESPDSQDIPANEGGDRMATWSDVG